MMCLKKLMLMMIELVFLSFFISLRLLSMCVCTCVPLVSDAVPNNKISKTIAVDPFQSPNNMDNKN